MPTIPAGMKRSSMTAFLKRVYVPGSDIQETINRKVPFLRMLQTQEQMSIPEGEKFGWPVEIAYSPAEADAIDTDDIPEADQGTVQYAYGNFVEYRRTVQLTGAAALESEAAMKDTMKHEMQRAIRAATLHHARSVFLSKTNLLAACSSAASATSLIVAAPGAQYIPRLSRVSVLLQSDGTTGAGVGDAALTQVTAITENADGTATLTLSAPGLSAFGSIDSTYGVYPCASRNKGIWGLPDIISTANPSISNYGEIDRTSVAEWQSQYTDAANASISGPLIAEMLNKIDINSPFMDTDVTIWCHHNVMLDLEWRVVNDRTFQNSGGNFRNIDLWGRVVHFGDIPIFKSRYCQKDRMYFAPMNQLKIAHPPGMPGLDWVKDGFRQGGIWTRVPSKIAFQAVLWRRWELIAKTCNGMGLIENINHASSGTLG